jgi:hypothetical protein
MAEKKFPVFLQKFQVLASLIFINMNKIIITENQLQKLIEHCDEENRKTKPLQLLQMVNPNEKK